MSLTQRESQKQLSGSMTVTYSFFVQTATTSTPAELIKASNPVPPEVKKLHGLKKGEKMFCVKHVLIC